MAQTEHHFWHIMSNRQCSIVSPKYYVKKEEAPEPSWHKGEGDKKDATDHLPNRVTTSPMTAQAAMIMATKQDHCHFWALPKSCRNLSIAYLKSEIACVNSLRVLSTSLKRYFQSFTEQSDHQPDDRTGRNNQCNQ